MMRIALCLLVSCLASAAETPPLKEVLRSTGKAIELFWEQFSEINCTESISQMKLDKNGKAVSRQESAFDYLVVMRQADGDLAVEESRVNVRSAGNAKSTPLLVTSGFSTLLFIFHPYFQNSFEYSQPEEDLADGRKALRVSFRHIRGAHSPSCLRLRGRDYPIEWSGVAWIEPASGAIFRITAALEAGMEDVGLQTLQTDVRYASVRFTDTAGEHWLPSVATIEAQTPLQHWRNIHRFNSYKRFTVRTETKTETPR